MAGLIDAEGTVSPHLFRSEKNKYIILQLLFTNTNIELVEYFETVLKELGLKPKVVIRKDEHVLNGKLVRRNKPLYMVFTHAKINTLPKLAKIGLHSQKRLLLSFFAQIAQLPPSLRYEVFVKYWEKKDGR